MTTHSHEDNIVEATNRVEAFSDGVYAVLLTLLILDLRVPVVAIMNSREFVAALMHVWPTFVAFTFSFFTIAIFWVNHHHFFHNIERTDWKLLWYNNVHLFFIALIPFATAFIGKYYTSVVPVALYAIVLMFGGLSMMLMIRYVLFHSNLLYSGFSESKKKSEFKRGMIGVYLYVVAAAAAFVQVYIAIAILVATPILFVVPGLLSGEERK